MFKVNHTTTVCKIHPPATLQARLRSSNLHLRPFQITPATCKSLQRAQPTLFTKFAPRHNRRPRYDPKWPPRHNASPLCAQNSHRATTGDQVTIQNGHRATTPAHFVHKIRTAPQRETTLRSKIVTAPHAHTQS